jgi:hypothetical protein
MNHLHLVPKLIHGAVPPIPQYVSTAWRLIKQEVRLLNHVVVEIDGTCSILGETATILMPIMESGQVQTHLTGRMSQRLNVC